MRLVDADELMEHVWRDKLDSRELIAKMVDNAPTVEEISTRIPIDVFKHLISLEPKTGHWIPVSERLPKYGEAVITVNSDDDYEINHIIDDDLNEWFYDGVIAWMPLPEPYKPQESEE